MSDNCSICQDVYKNPKLLMCGHTFCRKCIDNIVRSERTGDVRCPLCRKITKRPKNGAKALMDNFYASDRRYLGKILPCKECKIISGNKTCKLCDIHLCGNCLLCHMETKCVKKSMQPAAGSDYTHRDDEIPEIYMTSMEGRLMSESFHSNFCFDIARKIVVPNLFWSDDEFVMNINLSRLSCFNGKHCIVAPNHEQMILIYDEFGNELSRNVINIQIYSIADGILGYPLMIENGTSTIYEYSNEATRLLFWTYPLLPYDLASLNDGRIVLVGRVKIRTEEGIEVERHGGMCIYEYNGRLCNEVVKHNGEDLFNFPRHVCVNIQNNDIYIGDIRKKEVMYFRADGTFITSYRRREMEDIDFGLGITSELIIRSSNFPQAITFSQQSKLLFASFHSAVDRSIHILSPALELLGLFASNEELGVPAEISCDENGRLYVGDAVDGIIRVFKLSQFINRFSN